MQHKDSEIELLKVQLEFQRSLNATREHGGMNDGEQRAYCPVAQAQANGQLSFD